MEAIDAEKRVAEFFKKIGPFIEDGTAVTAKILVGDKEFGNIKDLRVENLIRDTISGGRSSDYLGGKLIADNTDFFYIVKQVIKKELETSFVCGDVYEEIRLNTDKFKNSRLSEDDREYIKSIRDNKDAVHKFLHSRHITYRSVIVVPILMEEPYSLLSKSIVPIFGFLCADNSTPNKLDKKEHIGKLHKMSQDLYDRFFKHYDINVEIEGNISNIIYKPIINN